jgi:dolichyl-phosphate-mannose-protein mannosyltransferase
MSLFRRLQPIHFLVALCVVAIGVGVFFRIYNLTFPGKQVFDEVYFPVMAQKYLHGESFFDVHPPLGKFIIALGIFLFGDTQLGWRIIPCLVGIGIIALMGYLTWLLFKDKVTALIAATFIAIDGMFIVYSRTGLMDGALFFAIFLCMVSAARLTKTSTTVWCGILLGLAIAIKWPAAAVFLPMLWYAYRAGRTKELWASLPLAVLVYFLVVYIGQVIMHTPGALHEALLWNLQAFNYHLHLADTHPWASVWWSWPLLLRPVLFLYDTLPDGSVQVITTLGNPLLWWSASAAVLGSTLYLLVELFRNKQEPWQHPLFPLILGYYAAWLPWAFVHRVIFLYHYMPAYGFALLILAYWLGVWWKQKLYIPVFLAMGILFIVTIRYLPFFVGWIPLTDHLLDKLIIIKSWLY